MIICRQCSRLNLINIYVMDICNESKIISQIKIGDLITERFIIGNNYLVYFVSYLT